MHLRCFAVLEQFFIKYFFASYFLELIIYSPFATNRPRQHQRLAIVAGEIRFSTSMHSYVFATTTTCAASDSFPHFHGHPHRSCIYLCSVWFDSPCNRKYFGGAGSFKYWGAVHVKRLLTPGYCLDSKAYEQLATKIRQWASTPSSRCDANHFHYLMFTFVVCWEHLPGPTHDPVTLHPV